jgi:predicted nuclease with TOPRIM domain
MEEWQIKLNELTTKLEMSQIEARQQSEDASQFKAQFEETHNQVTSLRRENKSLTGKFLIKRGIKSAK